MVDRLRNQLAFVLAATPIVLSACGGGGSDGSATGGAPMTAQSPSTSAPAAGDTSAGAAASAGATASAGGPSQPQEERVWAPMASEAAPTNKLQPNDDAMPSMSANASSASTAADLQAMADTLLVPPLVAGSASSVRNSPPVPNDEGVAQTFGPIDTSNLFFKPAGNGRACSTCHQETQGWSIKPDGVQARFQATGGTDPLFRLVDGANSPNMPVATVSQREVAYSMLLNRGVIRVGLPVPASAEFSLVQADDPYRFASASQLSLFRRPPPTANLKFASTFMWDGRETFADPSSSVCTIGTPTRVCFAARGFDLRNQANEEMQALFASFGIAMLIGVLCIYGVLVLLFRDFMQPATILAALPLSIGGAFVALLATRGELSMPSMIGLVMLMGIVAKNSILLVDYAILARRAGMDRFDALVDACRKRSRPIVMTSIAMGAGMMPLALGWGADPSFRAPMAIAVIGGLITSTLLSLLVVPVVFSYVDDLGQWWRRMMRGRGEREGGERAVEG